MITMVRQPQTIARVMATTITLRRRLEHAELLDNLQGHVDVRQRQPLLHTTLITMPITITIRIPLRPRARLIPTLHPALRPEAQATTTLSIIPKVVDLFSFASFPHL